MIYLPSFNSYLWKFLVEFPKGTAISTKYHHSCLLDFLEIDDAIRYGHLYG